MDSQSKSFKEAISAQRLTSHLYEAYFIHQYSNGSASHGGFVASTFLSVAAQHFQTTLASLDQPDLYLLNLQYLRPVALAKATFRVQDTKLGSLASLIHVLLEQDGKEKALAYITHVNFSRMPSATSRATETTSRLSSIADRLPRQIKHSSKNDPNWSKVWIASDAYSKTFSNVKLLLPNYGSRHPSVVEEWLRFVKDEDRFEATSLGYVADTWPQILDAFVTGSPYSACGLVKLASPNSWDKGIILDQSSADKWVTHWYPTLTMNVEVQKPLPEGGVEWLYQEVRALGIERSKVHLQFAIGDTSGSLIAVGNLSAMVVPHDYNHQAVRSGHKL